MRHRAVLHTITYLQGQQDMADSQQSAKSAKIEELTKHLEALQSECSALEEKQFSGMDVSAMQEELAECSALLKIQGLEEKKQRYEQVLHRELDQLDDEFSALKLLSQEFQIRICGMRNAA